MSNMSNGMMGMNGTGMTGHGMHDHSQMTTMKGGMHMGHGNGSGGSGMHDMDSMMMMKMYFHEGVDEVVLFEPWRITTVGGMVGSCIAIFVLACLYEGLKVLREQLLRRYNVYQHCSTYSVPNGHASSQDAMIMETHQVARVRMFSWPHLLQTCLHVVQVVISYFLMLIFMTYNVWLCISVALGAGVGYFIFGWKKAIIVDVNEHCH